MYASFLDKLSTLKNISSKWDETWVSLTIEGTYSETINKSYFEDLFTESSDLGIKSLITFSVLGENISLDSFVEELDDGSEWKLHINKDALSEDENNIIHTFFLSEEKFKNWASKSNPISLEHPFNQHKYSIEIYGISETFGGSQFVVSCDGNANLSNNDFNIDIEKGITSECNSFMTVETIIKPNCHYVSFGSESDLSSAFLRNSILVLVNSLCNELHEEDQIVVRGVRRLECKLGRTSLLTGDLIAYQEKLKNAVLWTYEKDCNLRHKLLLDRITLDLDLNVPFVIGLSSVIYDALIQAKERYNFATYKRQDEYYKELRDLLKDIKGMSEQCNQKIRSILSNLSRDVLGALLLVGVTLLSRISEFNKLNENHLVKYVFYGYGIYFMASALLQFIVDTIDLSDTNREFDYWKNISRNYISNSEFAKYKKETYGKRKCKFWMQYVIILLVYVVLSIICFKAYTFWQLLQFICKQSN